MKENHTFGRTRAISWKKQRVELAILLVSRRDVGSDALEERTDTGVVLARRDFDLGGACSPLLGVAEKSVVQRG